MNDTIKKCPMCAEEIPADATVCPYCDSPLTGPAVQEAAPAKIAPPGPPVSAVAPKKKSWIGWVIGAAVLLLLGGAVAIIILLNKSSSLPASLPIVAQPPTRTSWPTSTPDHDATWEALNADSTATVQAYQIQNFAGPILEEIDRHAPNFEDDFSDLDGVYDRWINITVPGVEFGDGVMHLVSSGWSAGAGPFTAVNFVISYDFKPVTAGNGSSVCSNFRSTDNGGYNFCVGLADDGWGMGGLPAGGEYYEIFSGNSNGVIMGLIARVTIIARGNEFAYYLDDRFMGYVSDDTYYGNWVDIGLYTPGETSAADIDNVRYWNLDNLRP